MAENVTIDIKLVTSQFQKGMDGVQKSLSKTNLAIGNMVGNLAADAFVAFSRGATNAFSAVFKGAKDLESTTKIFATLTGSMDDARRVVNDLRDAAAATPFEMPGLQKATTQLLTLNSITDENVIPTLMKLGDVAAVGSGDIEGLTAVFVKVQSQGKLTAETLESLTNQSPIMAQALVEAAGVNGMGALREAMAKGAVGADVLDKAIQAVTSEGGKAFNAMADQAGTLEGMMSNLSDNFTNLAGDIGTNLLPVFKETVSSMISLIEANKQLIINMATKSFLALGAAAKVTLDIIKDSIVVFNAFDTAIVRIVEFVAKAGIHFENWAREARLAGLKVRAALLESTNVGGVWDEQIAATEAMTAALEREMVAAEDRIKAIEEAADKEVEAINTVQEARTEAHAKEAAESTAKQERAAAEAVLKLEKEQELQAALLEQDAVFREEKQAREEAQKELEQGTAKEKLQFLQSSLGQEDALKRLAEINDLKARGDHNAALKKLDDARIAAVQKRSQQLLKEQEETNKRRKAEAERHEKGRLETFKSHETAKKQFLQMTEQERVQTIDDGLRSMTGLMKSGNKEMFKIGQAAAIAQTTMDTYQMAVKSYNALAGIPVVGPGLGAAAAAGAITYGLARVQNIQAQKFAQGGIVEGSSFAGDNVVARVNSGEMVLNRAQQASLFNMANGGNAGGGDVVQAINGLGERISNLEIVLVADDSEIARSTSRGVQSGVVIGESR